MANGSKDKPTVDETDPRSQWPKTAKACALAGISKRTLENEVRKGTLDYVYQEGSGERLFDPEKLAEFAGVVTDASIEADKEVNVTEQLRRALADMTKSNKELLTLATAPAFKAIRLVKSENKALRKRCRQLETDRIKSIEAFEAAYPSVTAIPATAKVRVKVPRPLFSKASDSPVAAKIESRFRLRAE